MKSLNYLKSIKEAKKNEFVIFNIYGQVPTIVHSEYKIALKEAKRLSSIHSSLEFLICQIKDIINQKKYPLALEVTDEELVKLPINLIENCSEFIQIKYHKLKKE